MAGLERRPDGGFVQCRCQDVRAGIAERPEVRVRVEPGEDVAGLAAPRHFADAGTQQPGRSLTSLVVRKDLVDSGRYTRLEDLKGMTIGIPGQYDDPRVVHAYETVIAACKRHGKYPGMGGIYDHPTMEKYIKMGARFVLSGSDLSFIMTGGQARADFLRRISV